MSAISHNGLKGALREIVIRELLEPLLPPEYLVGTGEIISAYGDTSRQIDVVICDRRVLPPILYDRTVGIFPLEAVIATIEVKSALDAAEVKAAEASAELVSKFAHAPPYGHMVHPVTEIEHVIPFLLGFGTDLTPGGISETDRHAKQTGSGTPALRGICVADRGYWYWAEGAWHEARAQCDQGAVVGMMASILNICQRVSKTRSQPDIRDYIDRPMPGQKI